MAAAVFETAAAIATGVFHFFTLWRIQIYEKLRSETAAAIAMGIFYFFIFGRGVFEISIFF
jgi:hypothetical protein